MPSKRPTEQIQLDIDRIIKKYAKCNDSETLKILGKLKKIRKKIDPKEALDTVAKILLVADKIRDLVDRLPPWN